MKLASKFFQRKTKVVAKELLGKTLVHIYKGQRLSGKIVEVEAYLGVKDKACHTFGNRRTKRTEPMYAAGGCTYIYLIYGMYDCINAVTEKEGTPEAVLIRALEPVDGVEIMEKNRATTEVKKLCSGPGKLCKALKITKSQSGLSLLSNEIFIEDGPKISKSKIVAAPRVGVAYAEDHAHLPLRFYIKDSPFISRK